MFNTSYEPNRVEGRVLSGELYALPYAYDYLYFPHNDFAKIFEAMLPLVLQTDNTSLLNLGNGTYRASTQKGLMSDRVALREAYGRKKITAIGRFQSEQNLAAAATMPALCAHKGRSWPLAPCTSLIELYGAKVHEILYWGTDLLPVHLYKKPSDGSAGAWLLVGTGRDHTLRRVTLRCSMGGAVYSCPNGQPRIGRPYFPPFLDHTHRARINLSTVYSDAALQCGIGRITTTARASHNLPLKYIQHPLPPILRADVRGRRDSFRRPWQLQEIPFPAYQVYLDDTHQDVIPGVRSEEEKKIK